jgi:hypothetical protein
MRGSAAAIATGSRPTISEIPRLLDESRRALDELTAILEAAIDLLVPARRLTRTQSPATTGILR